MNQVFKPRGYNSLSPYFIVNGGQRFIDLMTTVFGARELRRYDRPNGAVMHAELQLDDSVLMLSDATEKYPAQPLVLHMYVPDVDQTFEKAVQAGCEVIEPPRTSEQDPDRRATFRDFAGNLWSVGTQVSHEGA